MPAREPTVPEVVKRPVPTLIYDSRAWVDAESYDRLRIALEEAAQALAEASTELDAAGCQRASLYAAQQNRKAWDIAQRGTSA